MNICARCFFLLAVVVALTSGCLMQPALTDPTAITAYNNQVVNLLTPFIAPIVSLLMGLALWLRMKASERASAERSKKVIEEVREQKEVNVTALTAANSLNEKILKVQEQVSEQTKRAPARATDKAAVVVAVPSDSLEKVQLVTPKEGERL